MVPDMASSLTPKTHRFAYDYTIFTEKILPIRLFFVVLHNKWDINAKEKRSLGMIITHYLYLYYVNLIS